MATCDPEILLLTNNRNNNQVQKDVYSGNDNQVRQDARMFTESKLKTEKKRERERDQMSNNKETDWYILPYNGILWRF